MISFTVRGSTSRTERTLKKMLNMDIRSMLESVAQDGVNALAAATPRDSGRTAASWGYRITHTSKGVRITWTNSDIEDGFPVAIMLQYGHGTGTGGYVQGRDYINPAIRPIFDQISERVRKVVNSA